MNKDKSPKGDEAKTSAVPSIETKPSRQLDAAPSSVAQHEWAFDVEDRGFRLRGSYQDELGNNIEVTRDGQPFKTFTYPGYRIWNIAAHFCDYVDEWLANTQDTNTRGSASGTT